MLPEDKKEFVKSRVKSQVQKHWKKDFTKIVPDESKRLEIYKSAWALREKQGSAIPNGKLIQLLILHLNHWDKKGRGAKLPNSTDDNQGYHTISAR